jgi:hypothetical protein
MFKNICGLRKFYADNGFALRIDVSNHTDEVFGWCGVVSLLVRLGLKFVRYWFFVYIYRIFKTIRSFVFVNGLWKSWYM